MIRKAIQSDIDAVEKIYDAIHTSEEKGTSSIGWCRGIYPVRATAQAALKRNDLFVLENSGVIIGAAIINKLQVESYRSGAWSCNVPDDQICVLHTLVVSPAFSGKGYGRTFLAFYEKYAEEIGCTWLRMDTNSKNTVARAMYHRHGYKQVGIVPTSFNGLPGVNLVLLEKQVIPSNHA